MGKASIESKIGIHIDIDIYIYYFLRANNMIVGRWPVGGAPLKFGGASPSTIRVQWR